VNFFSIAAGRIHCAKCQAKSKRTHVQCRAPAMRGKRVCRFHGGKSTGPRTDAGRAACAAAKTVFGSETRAIREERRINMRKLKALAKQLGLRWRSP
jgi:hypothetical protein